MEIKKKQPYKDIPENMNQKKHILFLIPIFPSTPDDSDWIPIVQDFIQELVQTHDGYEFRICSFHLPATKIPYQWNNLTVYPVGGNMRKWPFRIKSWSDTWKTLKNIHEDWPISLIHAFWLNETAVLAKYFGRKYKIPSIVTLMGQDALKSNKYVNLFNLHKMNTVAISPRQQKVFNENFKRGQKAICIPMGIPESKVKINQDIKRDIHIFGAGSLIPLKNYSLFIEIIHALSKKYPKIKSVLAGQGPEMKSLKEKIRHFGLEDNIELVGGIRREEVFKYMGRSKILLHTSSYEGFGYVFYEALQAGMYVVSFPVGISHPITKWKTALNKAGMVGECLNIIENEKVYPAPSLRDMKETVRDYMEYYEKYF